jgi:hypothetical protein
MKVGGVYKIKYNAYDIYDIDVYLIKIVSEKVNGLEYYNAVDIKTGHNVHFYPKDWAITVELSSLEIELL